MLSQFTLVYDWVDNGNIVEYMEVYPDAPRPVLVPILLPNTINYLTTFSGPSYRRLQRVCNTFTPSTSPTAI